jgi:hypothetical protein
MRSMRLSAQGGRVLTGELRSKIDADMIKLVRPDRLTPA